MTGQRMGSELLATSLRDPRRVALGLAVVTLVALAAALIRPSADVQLYERYAKDALTAPIAHRLPVEYPALSAVIFVIAHLAPMQYPLSFALLMAIVLGGLVLAGRGLGAEPAWLGRLVWYLGLGTTTVLFSRYDLLPATAALIAVLEARRHRWGTAWIAAVLGGALQLFPFLLLPGFLIAEWRETRRLPWSRMAISALSLAAVAGLQHALAPASVLSPVRYELRRGFEFSSLPGSLTLLGNLGQVRFRFGFGAWEIVGSGHTAIADVMGFLAIASIIGLWVAALRNRLEVGEVALAVLSVAVLTDRALAPQYLIWLAPLWALWPLRRGWLASAALTTLVYPVAFRLDPLLGSTMMLAAAMAIARNVVLLGATLSWLRARLVEHRSAEPDEAESTVACAARDTFLAGRRREGAWGDEPVREPWSTGAAALQASRCGIEGGGTSVLEGR